METDMNAPLLAGGASDASEPPPRLPEGPVIGIIGSGDFSRSLAIRLVAGGFRVVVGSRDPSRVPRGLFPDRAELRSQREAADSAERVVFAALYPEHYHTLVGLREQLAGKVLVDVSNAAGLNRREQSNAERLAELFPKSRVVKGFNVVSAWALQTGAHDGSRQVLVCSDCSDSKAAVLQLARRLGFSPVDLGGLCASGDIEEAPLLLFPSWGGPMLATFLLFLFFYGYNFLRQVLLPYLDRGQNNFQQLPLVTVNQTLPAVALVTLAAVYLPGLLAAVLQLTRGTKYKRFPDWLDRWLCGRKQLGLLSFLCAALHAVYSMCLTLRRTAGQAAQNAADRQVSAGQSGLGYAALTLSIMHTLFFGWDFAFSPAAYPFYLPPVYLLALVLPCAVLVGRTFLALPCLTSRLTKIRRGWESARHRPPNTQETTEVDPLRACGDI
ncbi:metalloreductase STEAP3 isoform X3 [Chaetodon trifascialis]|uniref:metalloreductase STEAP3 isoform X3 n=1 Tax=Chaetodon trifascialis TaxID=109706 RepID=UPI00399196AE